MENENLNARGDSLDSGSAKSENNDMVSYESHKKLLSEKKSLQERFLQTQAQLEKINQDKMSADGQKDEVISSLRKQLDERTKETKELKSNFAWNTVKAQIKNEASANGCVNPDKLIRLLGKDQIAGIEIDDSFNVNKSDLSKIIEDAKKDHSDIGLFSVKKTKVHDVPSNAKMEPKSKKLDQMTTEELAEELKKLEA